MARCSRHPIIRMPMVQLMSDYTITDDSASAILGDTATAIDDGVSTINVDGPDWSRCWCTARSSLRMRGFETGFSADVNFNIVDDANDITAALSGDTTGAMDNAANDASGGTATVAEDTSDIRSVAGYDSGASSCTISDTAGAVLGATSDILTNDGVVEVNVDGIVEADIGADLGALEGSLNQQQQPIFLTSLLPIETIFPDRG